MERWLDLAVADVPPEERMLAALAPCLQGVARERTQAMQQQQPDLQFR